MAIQLVVQKGDLKFRLKLKPFSLTFPIYLVWVILGSISGIAFSKWLDYTGILQGFKYLDYFDYVKPFISVGFMVLTVIPYTLLIKYLLKHYGEVKE